MNIHRTISPKQYIGLFAAVNIVLLVLITVFAARMLFFDSVFTNQKLYAYQLEKLGTVNGVETVLVGDSSLGNAIDAELFSRLTSTKTVNLALTGIHGYAGSFNMIKKALRAYPVKNVVIVQSIDMIMRPVAYDGYLYTIDSPADIEDLDRYEKGRLLAAFYNAVLSPVNLKAIYRHYRKTAPGGDIIENDFVKQAGKIDIHRSVKPIEYVANKDKLRFLAKIVALCRKNNINLLYVHGPIWEPISVSSEDYREKIDDAIASTGIKLLTDRIVITDEDVGDSEDHVIPSAKAKYTALYAGLIKGFLR
ncbi:MAG: hypothetical protein JW844_04155 [Candidatus Omnitrophica bacterium]|nr:hypothetical protein [Candidatus Omnitrophota bacterium]